jgi:S-adenosylmethionine hydrolase
VITLASDFGSVYPAAMRGVCARRSRARLVDVAHDLPRGGVREAAFWLRFVLPEFPPAVHLAVVDPGVGTDRAALAIRAGDHVLVGPDNGLLVPAARRLAGVDTAGEDGDGHGTGDGSREGTGDGDGNGDEAPGDSTAGLDVYQVAYDDVRSNTFHGRDVFAPAAADAHVAVARESETSGRGDRDAGWEPSALATVDRFEPLDSLVDLRLPDPTVGDGRARGEVLVVDGFGNVITNLPGSVLDGVSTVVVDGDGDRDADADGDDAGDRRVPVVAAFDDVPAGDPLATVGSHGNVELDVNDGRGDEAFGLAPGDVVTLRLSD